MTAEAAKTVFYPDLPQAQAPEGNLLEPGFRSGQLEVQERLAAGGCGTVYRAFDHGLGHCVALKVMHQDMVLSTEMVARFIQEAKIVELIRHPNVVRILEFGSIDSTPCFTMELLSGQSLSAMVRERGRLAPNEAVKIFEQICDALAAAHAKGIIHRDVKATNVMVVSREPLHVKLLDFGIAKLTSPTDDRPGLTKAGRFVGTPTSMAPEQFRGERTDPRTDIYALGIMLYHVLTGQLPFRGKTTEEIESSHLSAPPPSPSRLVPISPALDAVVLRCLQKAPDARFTSVFEFLEALRAAAGATETAHLEHRPSAVGIHAEVVLPDASLSDDALDAIDDALDAVVDIVGEAGATPMLRTSTGLLAVARLEVPRAKDERDWSAIALRVHDLLAARQQQMEAVRVRVVLHVAEVDVRSGAGGSEIIGGELLKVGAWVREELSGSTVTPEAQAYLAGASVSADLRHLQTL